MSDILASVSVVLGAEISGFRAAMADARKELRGLVQFSEGLKDIGSSLTTYVSAPLALLGTAAVAASGKMEALSKGLNAISQQDVAKSGVTGLEAIKQASDQTAARLAVLTDISKAPGIGLEQAIQGDIRLRAVGISAADSAKDLKEFANAIATTGGTASDLDRVTVQLAQLSAKGKVLSQDLRPIIEAAPSVSQALLKMFGTIDSEAISAKLQKLGQNSSDFINQLTTELAKAPRVLGGFNNNVQNALNSATQSAAQFGDAIIKTFNLNGVLDSLSTGLTRLGDGFAALSPGVQRTIILLAGAAAAVGPVLVAVGTLGAALPAITAGFKVLGVSSLEALAPILPIAAAVAAAAFIIYENWDSIAAYFSSGEGSRLFSDLATAATSAVGAITGAFSGLRDSVGSSVGDMVTALGPLIGAALRQLVTDLTGALNVLAGTIKAVSGFFKGFSTGNFSEALDGAKQAAFGLIDPLAALLGFTPKLQESNPILVLSKSATEFNAAFPALQANVNALNALRLGPLISGQTGGITTQLGLLAKLKAELKEVQDQRDKETSIAAITADNARIISLQKQIAALEGTDKATKKATDALTKLGQELARLPALDNFLGDTPNQLQVLERRADTLQKGLKTLVDAGVSTSSRAFQGFATELVKVSQAFDKLQTSSSLSLKPVDVKSLIPQTIGDTLPQDVARLLGDYAKQVKPFELPVPVKLNMQAILGGPQPFELINKELVTLGNGFKEISAAADIFGGSFDAASAKIDVTRQALQNLISQGFTVATPLVRQLSDDLKNQVAIYDINKSATEALNSGLGQLASGFLEGLGQLAVGNLSLAAFGETVLGLVGKLATQLGEAIVAVGIGMLGLKTAFTNPFGAIAAGAALIVVGAALSSIASSAANSGGGSANVSTAVPSTPKAYTPATQASTPVQVTIKHEVVMVQRGSDLRGVLQIATTRTGRVVGSGS